MTERLLTPKEASSLTGLKPSTLREIARRGLIETVRPTPSGKHYRYTQAAIDAFIAKRTVPAKDDFQEGGSSPLIVPRKSPLLTMKSLDDYPNLQASGIAAAVAKKRTLMEASKRANQSASQSN